MKHGSLIPISSAVLLLVFLTACSDRESTQLPPEVTQIVLTPANPAAIYCQFLGGQILVKARDDGDQMGVCELPDGQSCEEWALYGGDCMLDAEVSDPFAFCAEIGNSLLIPPTGSQDPQWLPQALLEPLRSQGLVNADLPEFERITVRWRCMESEVYVCPVGANLPCAEQADLSRTPTPAMQEFCVENPDSDFLPAYVTGRATVYNWNCSGTEALAGEQRFNADSQGYLAEFWHWLKPVTPIALNPASTPAHPAPGCGQ